MEIKLKGTLDFDLQILGLKEGDKIHVTKQKGNKTGALYFQVNSGKQTIDCVVYPENYEIIEK